MTPPMNPHPAPGPHDQHDATSTPTSAEPPDPSPDPGTAHANRSDAPSNRLIGTLIVSIAILPIWIAVFRDGRNGLYPQSDAATTVLRATGVFHGTLPLVGMPAAGASFAGTQAYFPGAWQLYVLAVPTELFGPVWGPLIAMALLTTAWTALSEWLLFRRLTLPQASVAMALVAALLWSMGSGFMITPVPMEMVIMPAAAFLIAVWAVADGDLVAVPVLAVVANFLWLDHLVLVATVPMVGLVAAIGLWRWTRRQKRDRPTHSADRQRALRRSLLSAALITVVMWIPTVIQQLTVSPGNLRVLVASTNKSSDTVGSWSSVIHIVFSVIGRPRFWFRGTLGTPSYLESPLGSTIAGAADRYDIVVAMALTATLVSLAIAAIRRNDRTGLWLLIVAASALVMALITTYLAPNTVGTPTFYLRPVWATAMFVWIAVIVNLTRLLPFRHQRTLTAPAFALIVVLTLANLPRASFGIDSDHHVNRVVRYVVQSVVPRYSDGEPVGVVSNHGIQYGFTSALVLALATSGADVCQPNHDNWLEPRRPPRPCDDAVTRYVDVRVTDDHALVVPGTVLVRKSLLSEQDRTELAGLNRRIRTWLDGQNQLQLTQPARSALDKVTEPALRKTIDSMLHQAATDPSAFQTKPLLPVFASLVRWWYAAHSAPLFVDTPVSTDEWRRWLVLSQQDKTLIVSARTVS